MKKAIIALCFIAIFLLYCKTAPSSEWSEVEKKSIWKIVQQKINEGVKATRTKDIELYMRQLPEDLIIYDESGEIINREKQKAYALRDWAIIDTTLYIEVVVDSINFDSRDSIFVYTSQRWERMMFQRDGVTTDTVLTTQRHKETWKKSPKGWFGYQIEELGGNIFVNGVTYQ